MPKMPFPMEQILEMQREFAVLYRKTGLLAVNSDYIQVDHECLAELSDKNEWDLEQHGGRIHADVWIQEVKFSAVMTQLEFGAMGLELPE